MYIKNIYPYLVCGNYRSEKGIIFLTPIGVVEIENAEVLINSIISKCDGCMEIEEMISAVHQELDVSEDKIVDFISKLFQMHILTDKNSVFSCLSAYSQNPMLFFQDISPKEVEAILRSENQNDEYLDLVTGTFDKSSFVNLLESRQSSRTFMPNLVTKEHIMGLFWAAYGIQNSRAKKWNYGYEKTFTVPSGGAIFPLVLYYLNLETISDLNRGLHRWNNQDGFWRLKEQCNIESVLSTIDGLDSFDGASGLVIVCADYERVSRKYANKAYSLVLLEAGHAMQNAYLYCAENNLGFVELLGFDHVDLCKNMLINQVIQPVVIGVVGGINDEQYSD